ncbi:hypothetical protein RsTz2092_09310 [Deferribacterales bacterium RsTz2092]|nr:hypothetical protein AGMMS49941_08070 [Deferribacterales bacterium]
MNNGCYIAVGAGSVADLITLRGLNALKRADIILYDRLADDKLLKDINVEAVCVGKHPYSGGMRQADINALLEKHLSAGKAVARLKGGDSVLFSRIQEEIAVARAVGASIEIIPGVTAASAALARINSALTDRQCSSGVIYLSGHRKSSDDEMPSYDWQALVANRFTIVVYMGAKLISNIAEKLIQNGLSAKTPALVATDIEQPSEKLSCCTLNELKSFQYAGDGSAVLFVIGDTVCQM